MATSQLARMQPGPHTGMGAIRIGASGWIYKHWREQFYPRDLPPKDWFAFYSHEDVYELMRSYKIGLCIHDLLPKHPRVVTSNLVYLRFHGSGQKYGGSYPRVHLRRWAEWMSEQAAAGRTVYAYFNNDAEAHSVRNTQTLRKW